MLLLAVSTVSVLALELQCQESRPTPIRMGLSSLQHADVDEHQRQDYRQPEDVPRHSPPYRAHMVRTIRRGSGLLCPGSNRVAVCIAADSYAVIFNLCWAVTPCS